MRGSVGVVRLDLHGLLPLLERLRDIPELNRAPGLRLSFEWLEDRLALDVLPDQPHHLRVAHHVPQPIGRDHEELVPVRKLVVGDVGPGGQIGRGLVVWWAGVLTQDHAQSLLHLAAAPLEFEVTEGSEWCQDGEESVSLDDVRMLGLDTGRPKSILIAPPQP